MQQSQYAYYAHGKLSCGESEDKEGRRTQISEKTIEAKLLWRHGKLFAKQIASFLPNSDVHFYRRVKLKVEDRSKH